MRSQLWLRLGWLALIVLELAWLGWFLNEPLPNANSSNQVAKINRGLLAMRAIPHVVPGVTFQDSLFGGAWNKLNRLDRLSQRLPIIGAALLIAAAGAGIGFVVLRLVQPKNRFNSIEQLLLAFGLGMPCLGGATLVLGRLGCLNPWSVRIGLILISLLGWAIFLKTQSLSSWRIKWSWWFTPAIPFVILMSLGSITPPFDFDSLEYHLQAPKEWFLAGQITFLPHNVYTSMPFQVEMGSYLGMIALNDWHQGAMAGQFLIGLFAPMTALAIGLLAAHWGGSRAGALAAMIYLTTPWIYRMATISYVEGPLCFYHGIAVWLAVKVWLDSTENNDLRGGFLIGILAGGAMACKYPGLISAVLPLGFWSVIEAVRRRSWLTPIVFASGVASVMAPWLIKNIIDTGNPVYPLAYGWFGGAEWNSTLDAKWSAGHGRQPVTLGLLFQSVVDIAGRSDWQSPLYLAFAPLALIWVKPRRNAWIMAGFAAYLFATWWLLTHRLDRFWLPLLPVLAVLAGSGASALMDRKARWLVGAIIGLGAFSNLAHSITPLTSWNDWTADLVEMMKNVPKTSNPTLTMVDQSLPPDSKILLVGQAAVFHVKHPIVYNTVFNQEILETISKGRTGAERLQALKAMGVTHVYVDWQEVERHRRPGGYGFTDFITPNLFQELVAQNVLTPPRFLDLEGRQLFEVQNGLVK